MHERTKATLDELEAANWFCNVGQKNTSNAIVVASWDEALMYCRDSSWQDLLLEATNQYRVKILQHSKERYRQWNLIVEDIKLSTVPLVKQKIAPVVVSHQLDKTFEDTVQWDILSVAIEAEYADVYPPGFFASQAYWYVHGHFPCGWQGDFPDGTLMIY
jgi:hypothetical protein